MYRVVRVDEPARRIVLVRDGEGGGELVLEGVVLDAQSSVAGEETMLWVTEDCPYEEGLHIYLIDRDGRLIDAIAAAAPCSPGMLKILSSADRSIVVRFFTTDAIYRLEIALDARLRWLLPNGFKYKRALARHFLAVVKVEPG